PPRREEPWTVKPSLSPKAPRLPFVLVQPTKFLGLSVCRRPAALPRFPPTGFPNSRRYSASPPWRYTAAPASEPAAEQFRHQTGRGRSAKGLLPDTDPCRETARTCRRLHLTCRTA